MTEVAPGWHPDPTGRRGLRYWDGQRWTEQVSDPISDPVPAAGATGAFARDKRNDWRWSPASVVLAIAIVVVLVGIGVFVHNVRDSSSGTPSSLAGTSLTAPSVNDATPTTTAWFPPGYYEGTGASSDFAYKFSEPSAFTCQATGPGGCWQLVVITRTGCPFGLDVSMHVNTNGNTVIGTASGSISYDLGAGERAIVQVDTTQALSPGTTGGQPDISCA